MFFQGNWEFLPHLVDFPLTSDPGTEFQYSNLSSHLLGVIVTRACGHNLESFAQDDATLWLEHGYGRQSMIGNDRRRLTLDRPATYQIKVPGQIGESWSDWAGGMTIKVEAEADGTSITTLTGTLDQAALQGLLRQLYSVGLPLISAVCVEAGLDTTTTRRENENQGTE